MISPDWAGHIGVVAEEEGEATMAVDHRSDVIMLSKQLTLRDQSVKQRNEKSLV